MSTKEKQSVLNIYIEGFKPALRHAFGGGVESMCSVLNDFDGFQWKDFFQWKVESGKWKVCINELDTKHPSQTSPTGEVAAVFENCFRKLRMRVRVKPFSQSNPTLTRISKFRGKKLSPLNLKFYPLQPERELVAFNAQTFLTSEVMDCFKPTFHFPLSTFHLTRRSHGKH